jgi:hypothetical protein
MDRSNWGRAAVAGASGAVALTALHQVARMVTPDAPRMDVLGRRAIAAGMVAAGAEPPDETNLQRWALTGDILANTAYYSLIACGERPAVWRRALSMGLAAGAGALLLPQRMGLGAPPRSYSPANQAMTLAWYTLGGLVTAAVASAFARKGRRHAGFLASPAEM